MSEQMENLYELADGRRCTRGRTDCQLDILMAEVTSVLGAHPTRSIVEKLVAFVLSAEQTMKFALLAHSRRRDRHTRP